MTVRACGWYENESPTKIRKLVVQMVIGSVAKNVKQEMEVEMSNLKKDEEIVIGAVSINDITRALDQKKSLSRAEVMKLLPDKIKNFDDLFLDDNALDDFVLPPHRPEVDTKITLEKDT